MCSSDLVKLDDVKEVGTYLTGIFPLLFVPAAAGVMELLSLIHILLFRYWPTPVTVPPVPPPATTLSTLRIVERAFL